MRLSLSAGHGPRLLISAAVAVFAILTGDATHAAGVDAAPIRETSLRFISTRNRNSDASDASDYLGDGRGPTTYGRCVVEHEEKARRSRLDGLVDFLLPVKRARVVAVEERDAARFWRELDASLANDPSRTVVLFVHGYAYGFGRGCRRVSGLQRVLGDEADVILFSWPSDGNPLDYDDDREDLEWSVAELAAVIRELADRFGAGRIALAAHSMGTVGILDALQRLHDSQVEGQAQQIEGQAQAAGQAPVEVEGQAPEQAAGQAPVSADLVLFAPDYGIDDFRDRQAMLDRMVERTTVYVSEKDRLLWLSAALNGVPRLGQGGRHLATGPGFDTIDVSPLRRYHPTGHEYHVFHPLVEQDLVELLVDGAAASARTHTVEATRDGQRYFTLADSPTPDAGEEARAR